MEKNFRLGQSNELIVEEKVYDLHNKYDFSSFCVDKNGVHLKFIPNSNFGSLETQVAVIFHEPLYFFVSENIWSGDFSVLDQMGYKNKDDYDLDYLLTEAQSMNDSHFVFMFDNTNIVRVNAKHASLVEHSNFI